MPKIKQNVLDTLHHAEIICELADKDQSIPNIAKKIIKTSSTTWEHVKRLEKNNIVKKHPNKKTHYVLNYEKIVDLFEQRVKQQYENDLNYMYVFLEKNNNSKVLKILENVKKYNDSIQNKYETSNTWIQINNIVCDYFEYILATHKHLNMTINQIFDKLIFVLLATDMSENEYLRKYQTYISSMNIDYTYFQTILFLNK